MMKRNSCRSLLLRSCALALAATLAACGGGSDDAPGATAATEPLPAAGTSTGVTQAGELNYLAFNADGTTDPTVTATVSYTAPNGSLTLTGLAPGGGDLVLTTADDWVTVAFPAGYTGVLELNGNAAALCDGSVNAVASIFMSGNMTPVTNTGELFGKTFTEFECGQPQITTTFNADGSATSNYPEGVENSTASEIAAVFSEGGLTDPDGSNWKARAYKITVDGNAKYAIAVVGEDCFEGSCQQANILMIEN